MEYTNYARHNSKPVDGFILQAPVSDREGLEGLFPEWRDSLAVADQMIAEGKPDWCIPKDKVPPVFNCPMTAYRLRSLIAKGYVLSISLPTDTYLATAMSWLCQSEAHLEY